MLTGLMSPTHIALLAVVLLLVFGAKRLPEVGRSLGTGMREFKESIGGGPVDSGRPALAPAPAVAPPDVVQAPAAEAPASAVASARSEQRP